MADQFSSHQSTDVPQRKTSSEATEAEYRPYYGKSKYQSRYGQPAFRSPSGMASRGPTRASQRLYKPALYKPVQSPSVSSYRLGGSGLGSTYRASPSRWGWLGRRWSWLYPGAIPYADSTAAAQSISGKVQSCLAQVVGSWVPQTGVMGPATRRAIRIFQRRQGLPMTGLLDPATRRAIRSACAQPPPAAMDTAPPPLQEPPGRTERRSRRAGTPAPRTSPRRCGLRRG